MNLSTVNAQLTAVNNAPDAKWLNDELGLRFDPFRHLEAGADACLPSYLVDHNAFTALWGDWPSFLFAPAGGGKTAFRVRLARACRTQQDGRRILAAVFRPPRPASPGEPPEEAPYFETLLGSIAAALFMELAYRPGRFLHLEATPREEVIQFLAQNLPGAIDYYLSQMEESGSIEPLSWAFDPTAKWLPGEPLAERVRSLCGAMRETPVEHPVPADPLTRLKGVTGLLKRHFGYEAIYVLVDGIDAYVQEPAAALELLKPLLTRIREWQEQALFTKYFLPQELHPLIRKNHQSLLTYPSRIAIIKWDQGTLVEVVRERLRVASEGMFDSLTAISTPDVADRIEYQLAEAVRPTLPREVLYLMWRVFYEHTRRVGPYGRLEQRDFDAAFAWYTGL